MILPWILLQEIKSPPDNYLPEGDSPTVRRLRDRLKKLDAEVGDRIDSARTEYLLDLMVEEEEVDLLAPNPLLFSN